VNTKIKLHSISSTEFALTETAHRLKTEGYDPERLLTKSSMRILVDFMQKQVIVSMRVRHVYETAGEEKEVMIHTGKLVFHVYEGFDSTFRETAKGFAVTRETFDGLIRFFTVTTIGTVRGMLAAKAAGTVIENHPYKFQNIEKFMVFVERTNRHIQIKADNAAARGRKRQGDKKK
jgi:hypothetical protein